MEVHYHPKLEHGKRRFKEYFLEFFMIFLAVVLGFFAESIRENISDNKKGEEYIKSLIQNLQDDTTSLNSAIEENLEKVEGLKRLMSLSFVDMSKDANRKLLYNYCSGKSVGYYSIFKSNDATMVQLKNEGLRLIHKNHVADSIARYDNEIKVIYAAENLYNTVTETAIMATREVLNYAIYYDSSYYRDGHLTDKLIPLLSEDAGKLKLLFNKVDLEIGGTKNYIYNLQIRLPLIIRLIEFLKKEYHIK